MVDIARWRRITIEYATHGVLSAALHRMRKPTFRLPVLTLN
jgi:hypothetical protein